MVAAAVIGTAVIGGVASNKAANQQAKGVQQSIASTNALAAQARGDASGLYGSALQSSHNAATKTMDYFKQTNGQALAPLQQGNVLGQRALGQGYQQANNAILGLPVDMSFANNPQQITADYSQINNAQIPAQTTNSLIQPPAPSAQQNFIPQNEQQARAYAQYYAGRALGAS